MKHPTYGIVGNGRLAKHFKHYLELSGSTVFHWYRGLDSSPAEALLDADIVLLLISDDAIPAFVEAWPELGEKTLVHCSGSLTLPSIAGYHPLMSFGQSLLSLEQYQSIPFVIEEGAIGFHQVFPTLFNPSFSLPKENKGFYHALCVLACSGTFMLWQKLFRDFEERLGLPKESAFPLARQTLENVIQNHHQNPTGPFSRDDRKTIAKNLQSLDGDLFQDLYQALHGTFLKNTAHYGGQRLL